jgi:hypothetical protein
VTGTSVPDPEILSLTDAVSVEDGVLGLVVVPVSGDTVEVRIVLESAVVAIVTDEGTIGSMD